MNALKIHKFTYRLQKALSKAQNLAIEQSHTMVEPVHMLKALLQEEHGVTVSIITQAGGNPTKLKSSLNI